MTDFTHGKLYQIPFKTPHELHGIHPAKGFRLQDIAYNKNTDEIVLVEEESHQVWSIDLDGAWKDYLANLGKHHASESE